MANERVLSHQVCDMLRTKAAEMGHKAAKLPDAAWNRYIDTAHRSETLREAKLYIENYMMGNIEPQDLARVMAEDNSLRYTISDICKMRLTPVTPDIQRNDSYIDLGAGIKTFWTEMKVPLPSEVQAARDIRNLNFGIEAARAAMGKDAVKVEDKEETKAQTQEGTLTLGQAEAPDMGKSLHDRITNVRRHVAEVIMPKEQEAKAEEAEVKKSEEQKLDEEWLKTDEGQKYREAYLDAGVKDISKVIQAVEQNKDNEFSLEDIMKQLDVENDANEEAVDEKAAATPETLESDYSPEELMGSSNEDLKSLYNSILKHMSRDYQELQRAEKNNDQNQQQRNEQRQQESVDRTNTEDVDLARAKVLSNMAKREPKDGEMKGMWEGNLVIFKDNWNGHTFTVDEGHKLLTGESITFDYTTKAGKNRTATGKLEWMEYNGHPFIGFKRGPSLNYESKNEPGAKEEPTAESKTDSALFDDFDEQLMNYEMGNNAPASDEQHELDTPPVAVQMEEVPEDYSADLSDQDLYNLFNDSQDQPLQLGQ